MSRFRSIQAIDLESRVIGLSEAKRDAVSAGFLRNGEMKVASSSKAELSFIASTTKLFTFACFAMLQLRGDLSLDDSVARWLDRKVLRSVTHKDTDLDHLSIRRLLSHTSRIPDYYQQKKLKPGGVEEKTKDDDGWDFDEVISITKSMKPKPSPTKKSHYSGTNYQLLEAILDEMFGSYEIALKEFVLEPLGLERTFVFRKTHLDMVDLIQPLRFGSEKYRGYARMASLGAEGGIVSTVSETLKFTNALFSGRLLGSEYTNAWLSESYPFRTGIRYGCGVMFFRSSIVFGSKNLVGHIGATSHIAAHSLSTGSSFVVTTNNFSGHKSSLKLLRDIVQNDRREH